MKKNTIIVAAAALVTVSASTQSCATLASTPIGVAVVKQILLGGISKGLSIFKDKNAFLGNALIEAALPQQLKDINSTLQKIGLGSLVQKEKAYIAEAAAFTVNLSEPILTNAVNSLTSADITRVAQGGPGTATDLLREKTESQLIAALQPKVDAKLNEFGIVGTLNNALKGSSLLGGLFGGNQSSTATAGISRLASEQMVNGLFAIIKNHEQQNSTNIFNAIK